MCREENGKEGEMSSLRPEADVVAGTLNAAAHNQTSDGQQRSNLGMFRNKVNGVASKVDELEKTVSSLSQYYKLARQKKNVVADAKRQANLLKMELNRQKRKTELFRRFKTIFKKIMQHEWSWPFHQPVDVKGLGLEDYYMVIKKPMHLNAIEEKMECQDNTGYKNVREIYADVRLVFENAIKYNSKTEDVNVMATFLLKKFEAKWQTLLPKVCEEEAKQKMECAQLNMENLAAQEEADNARIAKESNKHLNDISSHLLKLKEEVVNNCREISTVEKGAIARGLTKLPATDLQRALDIITQNDSNFTITQQGIDIDIDSQSNSTLWRLKFFIKSRMEALQESYKCNATNSENDFEKPAPKRRRKNAPTPK